MRHHDLPIASQDITHFDLVGTLQGIAVLLAPGGGEWLCTNVIDDELVANVEKACHDFDPKKIEKGFITLSSCLDQIQSSVKRGWESNYKISHTNNGKDEESAGQAVSQAPALPGGSQHSQASGLPLS